MCSHLCLDLLCLDGFCMPSYVWIMDGLMLAYVYVIMGHCLACSCDDGLCFMKTNGISICTSDDRMHHVYLAYGFQTSKPTLWASWLPYS